MKYFLVLATLFWLLAIPDLWALPIAGDLSAGLAAVDVTPERGVPLGGYGTLPRRNLPWRWDRHFPFAFFLKPSTGVRDGIRAKALVLVQGNRRLLFVSLDVVGVNTDLVRDLLPRIQKWGFNRENILISATHTHSGPGTLARNWFWQLFAMDRFQPKVYSQFLEGIESAIGQAIQNLEPAELWRSSFLAENIQHNRRHRPGHFDPEGHLLWINNRSGKTLGALANLPVHGIGMRESNLHFSADVPGAIERALQAEIDRRNGDSGKSVVLFINGAEGDVSPNVEGEDVETLGLRFTQQAFAELKMIPVPGHWELKTEEVLLRLPWIQPKACGAKIPLLGRVPFIVSGAPRTARISALRIGDLIMMAWPGEPTTDFGLALRSKARESGFADSWILGLTNGHMGYFTTAQEYAEGGTEACACLHGPKAGSKLLSRFYELLPKMLPSKQ